MRATFSALLATALLAACQPAPIAAPVPTDAAPAGTAAPSASGGAHLPAVAAHWQCGEVRVDARPLDGALQLRFSGRTLALPAVGSPHGVRYADAGGNAFLRQDGGATLLLAGAQPRDCTRSDRASPWSEAEARGIAYRAVGSEPGWLVEVGSGDDPPLHAVLDYGERSIELAHVAGISSTPGYGGRTADGRDVVLRIKREPCRDGMSGEAFATRAELTVGGTVYHGCGAYLGD